MIRVVLDEMHDYTWREVRDIAEARDIARDWLATMWRRPGATLSIVVDGEVTWKWTGWRWGDADPRAHAASFNGWRSRAAA